MKDPPSTHDRSFLPTGVEVVALAVAAQEDLDAGMKLLRGEAAVKTPHGALFFALIRS